MKFTMPSTETRRRVSVLDDCVVGYHSYANEHVTYANYRQLMLIICKSVSQKISSSRNSSNSKLDSKLDSMIMKPQANACHPTAGTRRWAVCEAWHLCTAEWQWLITQHISKWPKSGGTNNIGVPPLRILAPVPPVFTPMHACHTYRPTAKSLDGWCPIATGLPCSGCRKTDVCL